MACGSLMLAYLLHHRLTLGNQLDELAIQLIQALA
jgi:hypothetical protein